MIKRLHLAATTAVALVVSACTSPAPAPATEQATNRGGSLNFKLVSGRFHCEQGLEVGIVRDSQNPSQLQIDWKGQTYAMNRNASYSGLPRHDTVHSLAKGRPVRESSRMPFHGRSIQTSPLGRCSYRGSPE